MLTTSVFPTDTLLLPTDRGMKVIQLATLIRVEAISNYSKLYFSDGKTLVVARVLRWFTENLPISLFIRIHHKHLINAQWLSEHHVHNLKHVVLKNNEILPIARRRRKVAQAFCNE